MNLTDAMLQALYERIGSLERRVAQLEGGNHTHAPYLTAPLDQGKYPAWPPFADPKLY